MIVRIVKMEFEKHHINDFIELFEERKTLIRQFPGCEHLELLQGIDAKANIFMTYSYWKSEEDLNNYRYSELFKETWVLTKKMFSAKAEATSFNKLHTLD